jgi:hypothetical protein
MRKPSTAVVCTMRSAYPGECAKIESRKGLERRCDPRQAERRTTEVQCTPARTRQRVRKDIRWHLLQTGMFNKSGRLTRRMARLLLAALLLAGCATTARSPAPTPDIGARIKALAAQHTASTEVTPEATYYSVEAYHSPRGYQTVLTYVQPHDGPPALTVTIYEKVRGAQHLTMLVDEGVDGRLKYVITATGSTQAAARAEIRAGHGRTSRAEQPAQAIYDALVQQLRAEIRDYRVTAVAQDH